MLKLILNWLSGGLFNLWAGLGVLLGKAFTFFNRNPLWLLLAIMATALAWTYVGANLDRARAKHTIAALKSLIASCDASNQAMQNSIEAMQNSIEAQNTDIARRANVLNAARKEAIQAQDRVKKDFTSTNHRIAALGAAVGQNEAGQCAVPHDVREALR